MTTPNQGKFLGALNQIQRVNSQPRILARVWTDKKGQSFPSEEVVKVGVYLDPLKENIGLPQSDVRGGTPLQKAVDI